MEIQRVESLYVATKIVTAWPEDRQRDLPEGAAPEQAPDVIQGYGVRYSDGYTSWCPKAKFEEDNLNLGAIGHLPAFQQRVIGEATALHNNITKLEAWLDKCTAVELTAPLISSHDLQLLREQFEHMVKYLGVLNQRIASWADPADLVKLYGTGDPLIENQLKGYTEQLAAIEVPPNPRHASPWSRPGEDKDSWLKRKLKEATENSVNKSDYFNDWTNVGRDTYNITLPLFNSSVNLLAAVESSGHLTDPTASVKDVSISSISLDGLNVKLENYVVTHGPEGRNFEIQLAGNVRYGAENDYTAQFRIVLNTQTGDTKIFCSVPGLKARLFVELENLNRRTAVPQYYVTSTSLYIRPLERNLFDLIEYRPEDGRLGPIGIVSVSRDGIKYLFETTEQSSGNTDRFIASVEVFDGGMYVGQFGVTVSSENGELIIVSSHALENFQVELAIVRPDAGGDTPKEVRAD